MQRSTSESLYNRAKSVIPGGVNSPVRAFNGVGGNPVFIKRAEGAYLFDQDDNKYIDYIGSWGPMILGHQHPKVNAAVKAAIDNGLSYGAPTEIEVIIAEKICNLIPSIEQVRMVNSGTEATMSALRLARGFAGKNKILKFEGCYHGHADSLLVKAGSGALTLGVPTSPGISKSVAEDTLTLPYNTVGVLAEAFEKYGNDLAAVIVEPIAGNMNCIPPSQEFLSSLRELCSQHGVVLIFDEVMTGFRVALGGAQSIYNIKPDMTCLGKVIGGGMPVGAFGGSKEIMSHLAPVGPVYQAGTLSGNPVAMTAGLTTLEEISQAGFYESLTLKASELLTGLKAAANEHDVPFQTKQVGAMFGFFFSENESICNFEDVSQCNIDQFKTYYHASLDEGVYYAPSAYEAGFISAAHSASDIAYTVEAAKKAFAKLG